MDYIKEAKYELILGIKNEESKEIINILEQYYKDLVEITKVNNLKTQKTEKQTIKYVLNVFVYNFEEDTQSKEHNHKYFFSSKESLIDFYENNKDILEKKKLTVDCIDYINPINLNHGSQEIPFHHWNEYSKK
jgi:hypothetical protein